MASLVWVRQKANLCEVCGRIMDVGEEYKGHCRNCSSYFCRDCGTDGVCNACSGSSLFRAGQSLALG